MFKNVVKVFVLGAFLLFGISLLYNPPGGWSTAAVQAECPEDVIELQRVPDNYPAMESVDDPLAAPDTVSVTGWPDKPVAPPGYEKCGQTRWIEVWAWNCPQQPTRGNKVNVYKNSWVVMIPKMRRWQERFEAERARLMTTGESPIK